MSTSSTGLSGIGSSILGATGISSPGIGSGLDVNGIVTKLMAVEAQPITLLQNQQTSYQTQLSALGSVSSALSSLQSSLASLTNLSQLQSLSATPSNSAVLTASASASAIPASYSIGVTALAQAQTLVATGQTSTTAAIGTGTSTTLTFSFGTTAGTVTNGVYQAGTTFTQDPTQPTKTVTINSTNNSLLGIMNAINAAGIGVTATIVNDGSATPYRLQITSSSGASHSMSIAVSGDATLAGLLNYDPTKGAGTGQNMTQSVTPQNAALTVNGLSITSASNTISTAISGVTLNLAGTGSSTLSTAYNTAAVQSAIQGFVTAYNNVNSTINTLTAYNTTTKKGGPLLGDFTTLSVQNGLRNLLSQPLAGLGNTTIKTLYQLGVTFQSDGSLAFNTSQFQSAAASNPGEIAAMFAPVGKPTDSLVNYSTSTSSTKAGNYAVNITQLATQGGVTGNANVSGSTTITTGSNVITNANTAATGLVTDLGVNTISFTVSVGGGAANTVTVSGLTTGASFNAAANASAIVNAVNANAAVKAAGLVAAQDAGGHLYFSTTTGQSATFAGFTGFAGMSSLGTGLTNTFAAAGPMSNFAETDTITVAGVALSVAATGTAATDATALKNAINANTSLQSMGITAALSTTGDSVVITAADARAVSLAVTPPTGGKNSLTTWGFGASTVSGASASKYNNVINLNLDGNSSVVTLAAGTYTSAQLATLVQTAINGNSTFSAAGSSVSVAVNGGGNLAITSSRYGSSSKASVTGGGTGIAIMGTGSTSTTGVDVAGTIGGGTATGSGQYLTGGASSAASGLQLQIVGGATGARGTVNFSLGYGTQLSNAMTGYLSSTGLITNATNGINTNIQNINNQITKINSHLADVQKNYLAQFTALDTLIAQMTQTSNYLTQQLTSMSYTQKNYG